MAPRNLNLDAAQSVFFTRQLEFIRAEVHDVLYPELQSRQILPVDSSAGDGIDTIVSRQEDSVGEVKVITDYADDLPRSDVFAQETTYPVRDLGGSFGYSIREIRAAARAGVDLSGRKARSARKSMETALDTIGATGDANAGLPGFINNALITPASVANPGGGTAWSTKTPAQILVDLNEIVATPLSTTNGIHVPNTILLPLAEYTLISQTRMTDLDVTILKFFLSVSPHITAIVPWYKLNGAGAGATNRMISFDRSPDVVQLVIPTEFEMFDPQLRNLEYVVVTRQVTSGVHIHRPGAITFRDGI